MDAFLDALQDAVAWVVTSTIVVFITWATWLTRTVMDSKTRLAVLEETVTKTIPDGVRDIKATLREMRDEAGEGRERLYDHVDSVRKELKADIKDAKGKG